MVSGSVPRRSAARLAALPIARVGTHALLRWHVQRARPD
jgi:hypothetical protein